MKIDFQMYVKNFKTQTIITFLYKELNSLSNTIYKEFNSIDDSPKMIQAS